MCSVLRSRHNEDENPSPRLRGEGREGDSDAYLRTIDIVSMDLRDIVRLRKAKDRMDREFDQPLDVPALASSAAMSTGHFSRSFKAAFDESPYSYLMTRRIERAKALLRRGDMSVTDVCFAVGCTSLGSFSARFTELVGESPSVYRARSHSAAAFIPPCLTMVLTKPIRNEEAALRQTS